jgi:hypothetical protein
VGIEDLDLFADQWLDIAGCSGIDCGDFNNDTQINLLDMAILARNWMMGAACQ